MLPTVDLFSEEHRIDESILGQWSWLTVISQPLYHIHLSTYISPCSLGRVSSGGQESTGWGRLVLGRVRKGRGMPPCQSLLGTVIASTAEDQAHYIETFFLMARCMKILKVKLYARNC